MLMPLKPATNRFLGSTVALWIGTISLAGGISQIANGDATGGTDTIIVALVIILGSLAYRSLKQRRLGLKEDTAQRRAVEGVLLVLVLLSVVLQKRPLDQIHNEPFGSLYVPVWIFAAYAILLFQRPGNASHKQRR
jgi:hypothetical protein